MDAPQQSVTGGCLCGGVGYRLHGSLRPVINCFCRQCRKTTGHHFAATRVRHAQLEMLADETLRWYRSSDTAERGFCHRCGSSLFWRDLEGDGVSVTAGSIDPPTGLETLQNIFVDDASDYQIIPPLSRPDCSGSNRHG